MVLRSVGDSIRKKLHETLGINDIFGHMYSKQVLKLCGGTLGQLHTRDSHK